MFRRSAIVFVGFLFLVLALIVGYALTGLSGPRTAIEEARQALDAGRPGRAIRLLNTAEQSLGATGDRTVKRSLLEIRYRAHVAVDNLPRALEDLNELIDKHSPDDPELLHEQVRVLISADLPERALRIARQRIEAAEDDGRALELAGEATQRIYQRELGDLLDDLRNGLPPAVFDQARDALLPHVYRDAADPVAIRGKRQFDTLLKDYRIIAQLGTTTYDTRLREIRAQVQRALEYYRRSLAAEGTPVAAYRGLAFALGQGERNDDLVALSEIYLRRFRHLYSLDAAHAAAVAHLENNRPAAVVELCERMLPVDGWRTAWEENRIDRRVGRLLAVHARALYELRDRVRMDALFGQLEEIEQTTGMDLNPDAHIVRALHYLLADKPWEAESQLAASLYAPAIRRPPVGGEADRAREAIKLRLEAAEKSKPARDHILGIYDLWIELRPTDPEPHLLRARFLLSEGLADEAAVAAAAARELAGNDDDALWTYVEARNASCVHSGQDATNLLELCGRLGQTVPPAEEVIDNALYLALARTAIDRKAYAVAADSARVAMRYFTWSRWPRKLQAEAAIAANQPDRAIALLTTLREMHGDDEQTIELLRAARAKTDTADPALYFDIARNGESDVQLAEVLLRRALERNDLQAARKFAEKIIPVYGGHDVRIPLLGADMWVALGEPVRARQLLQPIFQLLASAKQVEASDAVAAHLLEIELRAGGNPGVIQAVSELVLRQFRDRPGRLLELAELAEKDYPLLAERMIEPVLGARDFRRNAQTMILGGRIALRNGDYTAATERFTAAVPLETREDSNATVPLALLLLEQGYVRDAEEYFPDQPATNAIEALINARLGRAASALAWAQERLATSPRDVVAQTIAATANESERGIAELDELLAEARSDWLDGLMFATTAGFREFGIARAESLIRRFPDNPFTLWLRAHAQRLNGQALVAGRNLKDLVALHPAFLPAYDDLLIQLDEPAPGGRDARWPFDTPALRETIAKTVAQYTQFVSPRLQALAMEQLLQNFTDLKRPAVEFQEMQAKLWTLFPEESRAGVRELDALIRYGRSADAWKLLIHHTNRAEVPFSAAAQVFAAKAREVLHAPDLSDDPTARSAMRELVRREAARLIDANGPYGALIHLLFELEDPRYHLGQQAGDTPLAQRKEARLALLQAHFDAFRSGTDRDGEGVVATLREFMAIEGRPRALGRVDAILRSDPSLISAWAFRADLLEDLGRHEDALASLRWLFDYCEDDDVLIEYSRIAGEASASTPSDEERLANELDTDAANGPAAAYARGLLALRAARYREAAVHLADAAVRDDGGHLFYRALALLSEPGEAAGRQAGALFRQLHAEYAESPHAENAANFADQLGAPRADAPAAANR